MPYWKLYYHFVWGTKHRLPLIDASFETKLYRVITAKAHDMDGFVHAIGGMEAGCRVESIHRIRIKSI
jgi:putative transposase